MEITAADQPINGVLDQYYSWLVNLMGPNGKDRVALLSTIVTHDIVREAPLYTQEVFRSFVDRTISISPEDLGAGNYSDRYSRRYSDLINTAAAELYAAATYTPEQEVRLQKAEGDITEAITEINSLRREANDEFLKVAKEMGLKPGTPEYDLERAKVFNPYLTLFSQQLRKMNRAEATREAVHMSVFKSDRAAAELSRTFERCIAETSKQILPTTDDIEKKYNFDPIKIAEAAQTGLYSFSRELGVDPSSSLVRALDMAGQRDVSISNSHTAQHNHDRAWKVSASGGWGIFKAKGSAQAESHFRQSIANLESIIIGCDYMGEYWVRRRDWFDSAIYKNKYVQEQLEARPDLARLLALCISSAIIVRGLKITYVFKNKTDTTVWSSWNAKASGGFKVFGVGFGGIGGGGSGSNFDHVVDEANRSVTFFDGPGVCRLLALRASNLIEVSDDLITLSSKYLADSNAGSAMIEAWRSGQVLYGSRDEEALDIIGKGAVHGEAVPQG